MQYEIVKVEHENDPERCLANPEREGICQNKSLPGAKYCAKHGGNKALEKMAKTSMFGYRLGKYQQRMEEFANDSEVKSLRAEIGITRMLIEELFAQCQDAFKGPTQLMIMMPRISELIGRCEKLVKSCNQLEAHLGITMDRTQVLNIGTVIVNVISDYVKDPNDLEIAAQRIMDAILQPQSPTN